MSDYFHIFLMNPCIIMGRCFVETNFYVQLFEKFRLDVSNIALDLIVRSCSLNQYWQNISSIGRAVTRVDPFITITINYNVERERRGTNNRFSICTRLCTQIRFARICNKRGKRLDYRSRCGTRRNGRTTRDDRRLTFWMDYGETRLIDRSVGRTVEFTSVSRRGHGVI